MQHRTSSERSQQGQKEPLTERLWRNQLGIILAIVLTVAALAVLVASLYG